MLKHSSAMQTVVFVIVGMNNRSSLHLFIGVQPTGCGSQPLILWNSEAVALAPPPTHAVHKFHIFSLNALMTVILPDCVLVYDAESRLLFFACLCSYMAASALASNPSTVKVESKSTGITPRLNERA